MSKPVFGFDIDGVLTNDDDGENNIWLTEASRYFDEPLKRRVYSIEEAFDKSALEVQEFFNARVHAIYHDVPPRDHAIQTLQDLWEQECTIHLITARDERHRSITEHWLMRHNTPYHSLSMRRANQGFSKGKRCRELQVEFFVEDKVENAIDVANQGVYTLLYHASHNLDQQTSLPLVRNWLEVQEHIDLFFAERLGEVP